MKIYLSFPITGLDIEAVEAQATFAAALLESKGYEIVSPLDIVTDPNNYAKCMGECIEKLLECEAICMLGEWTNSNGCYLEFLAAQVYDKKIFNGLDHVLQNIQL